MGEVKGKIVRFISGWRAWVLSFIMASYAYWPVLHYVARPLAGLAGKDSVLSWRLPPWRRSHVAALVLPSQIRLRFDDETLVVFLIVYSTSPISTPLLFLQSVVEWVSPVHAPTLAYVYAWFWYPLLIVGVRSGLWPVARWRRRVTSGRSDTVREGSG